MTPFSLSSRVTADDAKQDKIELILGAWYLHGRDSELRDYFRELGAQPVVVNSRHASSHTPSRLFNLPTGRDPTAPRLLIPGGAYDGDRRVAGAPLISGYLQAGKHAPNSSVTGALPQECRSLSTRLSINPTRFVHHQNMVPVRAAEPAVFWRNREPRFTTRTPVLQTSLEASLDGNDNVLLSQRAQHFGRPVLWPIHLERYWEAIQTYLDRHIQSVADQSGLQIWRDLYLNLRSVQTYWEFSAEDPIAVVRSLVDPISSVGHESTTRSYPLGQVETNVTGNSTSLKVRIGSGRILRIYAKTTGRIRFEIDHDLVKNPRLLPNNRHTSSELTDLIPWIHHLAGRAADDVNRILQFVERQSNQSSFWWMRSYHLVHAIAGATNNSEVTKALLSLLVNHRRIHLGRHDPLRPHVQQLVDLGMLARVAPRRQQFVVTPKYRGALEELRPNWLTQEANRHSRAVRYAAARQAAAVGS